nr:PREDICTED: brain acid soluble protein 1-like [Lepisosteus oculatus]
MDILGAGQKIIDEEGYWTCKRRYMVRFRANSEEEGPPVSEWTTVEKKGRRKRKGRNVPEEDSSGIEGKKSKEALSASEEEGPLLSDTGYEDPKTPNVEEVEPDSEKVPDEVAPIREGVLERDDTAEPDPPQEVEGEPPDPSVEDHEGLPPQEGSRADPEGPSDPDESGTLQLSGVPARSEASPYDVELPPTPGGFFSSTEGSGVESPGLPEFLDVGLDF